MLVPGIAIVVLALLISGCAKEHAVSSTKPMLVALGVYLALTLGTSGLLKVKVHNDGELMKALFIGAVVHVVVAAVVYVAARAWIRDQGTGRD